MANVNNINKVIRFLKKEAEHFDMSYWFEEETALLVGWGEDAVKDKELRCGTVMCIGGACGYLMLPKGAHYNDVLFNHRKIARWLEITPTSASNLFYMSSSYDGAGDIYGDYDRVTVKDAIAMLQELKRAGRVDKHTWKRIAPHAIKAGF